MSFTAGNQEWKKRKANNGRRRPRVEENEIKAALEKAKPEADVLQKLAEAINRREPWAITLYLSYKWGKPKERLEHTGPEGQPIEILWIRDETEAGPACSAVDGDSEPCPL